MDDHVFFVLPDHKNGAIIQIGLWRIMRSAVLVSLIILRPIHILVCQLHPALSFVNQWLLGVISHLELHLVIRVSWGDRMLSVLCF